MRSSTQRFVLLCVVALVMAVRPAHASDCVQQLDRLADKLKDFQNEADKNAVDFIRDDVGADAEGVIERAKKAVDDLQIPAWDRYRQMEEAGKRIQDLGERAKRYQMAFDDFLMCLSSGDASVRQCAEQVASQYKRIDKVIGTNFSKWAESLPDDLGQASNRVKKASSFLGQYTAEVVDSNVGSVRSAASCLAQQREQLRSSLSQEPVNLGESQSSPPAGARGVGRAVGRGSSGALVVAGVALAAGAGVAVALAAKGSGTSQCSSDQNDCGDGHCCSGDAGCCGVYSGHEVCCPGDAVHYCPATDLCYRTMPSCDFAICYRIAGEPPASLGGLQVLHRGNPDAGQQEGIPPSSVCPTQ